jgi:hypothetical protein
MVNLIKGATMKAIFLSALASLFAVAANAATPNSGRLMFSNGAIMAAYQWVQGPDSTAESVLQMEWMDGRTMAPITPPAFAVALVMPAMPSMKNPPTQINQVVDAKGKPVAGSYLVRNIYFTMGGDWDVNVTLDSASGKSAETQSISIQLAD